ncbi:replication-associated recombination protein A [Owenweeksia hongkongensis]|uniref:replication-associated recombination protein A n=1 Tax=Owenweeksia hongkongensis TaxID=253245 RepID=UPI003A8D88F0
MSAPLAERLRPKSFDDYIGQEELLGKNGSLTKLLNQKIVPSMIFWGPPGVGKTTLAGLIAKEVDRPFFTLSAINSGVKDVREVIQKAENQGIFAQGKTPILFIDEIHRFSKSQQDSLLGAVEKGTINLIGATTENPSFEVISALLSRCQVYVLKAMDKEALDILIDRALEQDKWLKSKELILKERQALLRYSGGDARKLLNTLELVAGNIAADEPITNETVEQLLRSRPSMYDKNGEQHYDIISALIKSIRGSDPNAAVYWLARMIEGGEDPSFIARRLLISASEDVGMANPNALLLANTTFDAVKKIGWPESRIILSQCAVYLATSPKSNASYEAIGKAQALVKETGDLAVPLHIRNAPTKLMKELGYGADYKYSHAHEGNFADQEYLPNEVSSTTLYNPGNNPKESGIRQWLQKLWPKYKY